MNVALNTRGKRKFSWIVKKGANQYRELNFDTSQGGVGGWCITEGVGGA